jgi:prolyl oligopeptidase
MDSQKPLQYPETRREDYTETLHGISVPDPYRWLENGSSEEVLDWTEKQDQLSRSVLHHVSQRDWLLQRNRELLFFDDEQPPREVLHGNRVFWWKKSKNDERWIYYTAVRRGAEPVELINPNHWDTRETLDFVTPSTDGKWIAFGKSVGGNENPVICIMDVETKTVMPDKMQGWRQRSVSWMNDNSGFLYSANAVPGSAPQGEEFYWRSVFFHRLGTPANDDFKVFGHPDIKEYNHHAVVSEKGAHVLLYRTTMHKNEVFIMPSNDLIHPEPIVTGLDARYWVIEVEGRLFIITNKDAPNQKVFVTRTDSPGTESWKEFLPETSDILQDFYVIANRIYVLYLHHVKTLIKIYDLDGACLGDLPLPGIGHAVMSGFWSKPETLVRFMSFTDLPVTYTYDHETRSLHFYHRASIPIDTSPFVTEQFFFRSRDGVQIPLFLIHRKNMQKTGDIPVVLTAYGGFNIPMTPNFEVGYLNWVSAGGMVAVANIRGGGEYGESWHRAAIREKRQNAFDDFICAAEWLIDNNYTNPDRLAIRGGSNGGLLVGVAAIQRPELFRAVCCSIPLLDMLRYHKFSIGKLWIEEYGNPENPDDFKFIYQYSPYHNVQAGASYPAMLFIASINDSRVDPLHARKMAARMQSVASNGNPVLFLIQRDSGHAGGTTISARIEQASNAWAFLMDALELNNPLYPNDSKVL